MRRRGYGEPYMIDDSSSLNITDYDFFVGFDSYNTVTIIAVLIVTANPFGTVAVFILSDYTVLRRFVGEMQIRRGYIIAIVIDYVSYFYFLLCVYR